MKKTQVTGTYLGYKQVNDGIELIFKLTNYRYLPYFTELEPQEVSITLTDVAKKRSNEQNALLWKLIHEIAKHENSHSNDDMELYCYFLEKANQHYTYLTVLKDALDTLKANARVVQVLGYERRPKENTVWAKCRVFFGSSEFDSKEMSVLIDTVLNYATELGIDVTYYKDMLL